jgi:CRISPR-associated protein Csb2
MSTRTFTIRVTFLVGSYHGEEWPPAPARLFQGLVGGVHTCGYAQHAVAVEPALRWLERQPPPVIRACPARERSAYRIAVPNNDMDVIAAKWAEGKAGDPALLRTMKEIRTRELSGDGPHVQYIWQVDSAEAGARAATLESAAQCLHTLGWGVDMAFADTAEPEAAVEVWTPATSGERFAVPMAGTLDDLYATYSRFVERASDRGGVDTHTRPSLVRMQPYRREGDIMRPAPIRFLLLSPSGDIAKAVPWQDAMRVSAWLRHAAAQQLTGEYELSFIEAYVQGHTREEEKARRLSYVPVPSLFSRYGDGRIRRAMIVEPPDAVGEVSRMLRLKLTGQVLVDVEGRAACSLAPAADDGVFSRYLPRQAARRWRSVTPVVLHGWNAGRGGAISLKKTERLLLRAFEMAGYGEREIASMAFQTAPWFIGPQHAGRMRVPAHLEGFPRVHVEVEFRRGFRGPVLAGIGRHYGIGLFAAVE